MRAALWIALLVAAAAAQAAPPPLPPLAAGPRIVVAFANLPHEAPAPAGTTGAHYGGGGYRLAQGAQHEAQRVERQYRLRQLSSWPIQALAMHCVVYEVPDGREMSAVLEQVSRDAGVLLAEPLHEFHTLSEPPAYNDPLYDLQDNLDTLGIARAHQRAQGAGIKVALIDTAVDAAHPDLLGRIVRTHSYLSAPAQAAASRHGTAMAGLIAAVANNHIGIVGIAPLAQIEVFAACWQLAPDSDAAACNTFTLAQALAGALASGAPLVNLSIGGPKDALLGALIAQGVKRGVIFVGAAPGGDAGFPTAESGVIVAGASEHPLPRGALGAPGEHVLTLRPQGQYDFESGSSVAAAELTGVVALLMSASSATLGQEAITGLLQPPGSGAINAGLAMMRLASTTQHGRYLARTP